MCYNNKQTKKRKNYGQTHTHRGTPTFVLLARYSIFFSSLLLLLLLCTIVIIIVLLFSLLLLLLYHFFCSIALKLYIESIQMQRFSCWLFSICFGTDWNRPTYAVCAVLWNFNFLFFLFRMCVSCKLYFFFSVRSYRFCGKKGQFILNFLMFVIGFSSLVFR